ncbi:MAG: sugar ABC transporter permease [Firmicutes bacterium]|nr:sugar ABC transporter permease [Bacillota bacterium]
MISMIQGNIGQGFSPRRRRFRWDKLAPFAYIAPFLVLLLAFNLYTFFFGARMSLTDATGIDPGTYVGFSNYKWLFTNTMMPTFLRAMRQTFLYTFFCLLTQIPAAFILAVILNGITSRLRGLLRASFYVPVLINTALTALLFQMLFNQDSGAINWFLGLFGVKKINWLFDARYTLPVMVATSFWQWTGYHMVYLLAALQVVDPTLYEVAKIDGASPLRTMFQITLPYIRPALTFVTITSTIGGLQQFEYSFLIFPNAGYGPGKAAMTAVPFIYYKGFNHFELGISAAAGLMLFIVIFVASLLQLRFLKLGEAEEF